MHTYQPHEVRIIERIEESPGLITLRLQFTDEDMRLQYSFEAGQFNMLYLFGVGEIAISIVSDPKDDRILDHTIRSVGRVSNALSSLREGDTLGIRGPYGRGWPMKEAEQKDVVIMTGGLGCAPVVSAINYISNRRERYGHLNIVQGVKHSSDMIWKDRYDQWQTMPMTNVFLSADRGDALWPGHVGRVTELVDKLEFDIERVIVMLCGPEPMIKVAVSSMLDAGVAPGDIWISMERNMQCAAGHCGHCQFGESYVCKDGPVFCYEKVSHLCCIKGF